MARFQTLGTFGKGCVGSVALNFAPSASANCASGCEHFRKCYAARAEKRGDRAALFAKLIRHYKSGFTAICRKARAEISSMRALPWLRISAFGSVPNSLSGVQLIALRELLKSALARGARVHFPVETARKARMYQLAVGDLVTVRESATSEIRFLAALNPVSIVAGDLHMSVAARVKHAIALAKESREMGRPCAVCPAIVARAKEIKCGTCTLCANPNVNIIYPAHA